MATPVRLSACSILLTETTLKAWYSETLNIICRRALSDPTGLEQDKISDTRCSHDYPKQGQVRGDGHHSAKDLRSRLISIKILKNNFL